MSQAEEDAYQILVEYEEEKALVEKDQINPKNVDVSIVLESFRINNVYVLSKNIERLENLSDKFLINEARTEDGDIFSSKYNATTKALYEIELNGQIITNSLLLSEVNEALKIIPEASHTEKIEVDTPIITKKSDNGLTFELRRETALKKLQDLQFDINKENLVKDSNDNLIANLKISEVFVTFILNEVKETANDIVIDTYGEITEVVDLKDLKSKVDEFVKNKTEERIIDSLSEKFVKNEFMFSLNNITKLTESEYEVKNIYDQTTQILFSGICDLDKNVFTEVNLGDL